MQEVRKIAIQPGVAVWVPDDVRRLTPYVLMEQGDWCDEAIDFVRHLEMRGMGAVDIDADYGVYTLVLAALVGDGGRVWAFWQASGQGEFLERSIAGNGFDWVELMRAPRLPDALDADLERFSARPVAFVRLGAADAALDRVRGGARFFATHAPLVLYHADPAVAERLATLGYATYRLIPGLGVLAPHAPGQPHDRLASSVFACRPERARQLAEQGLLVAQEGAIPAVADDYWLTCLRQTPWAAGFAADWSRRRGAVSDWPRYRQALDDYFLSTDAGLPTAVRLAALRRSHEALTAVVAQAASLPRLCTLARVASACGQRGQALDALGRVYELLRQGGTFDLNEPLLPVDARFEAIAPGERLADWLIGGVLETLERLGQPSSWFDPQGSRRLLESASRMAFFGAQAQRRLELVRRRLACAGENDLFDVLPKPDSLITVVDIGAMMLGDEPAPYTTLLWRGLAHVTGFEPNAQECAKLNRMGGAASRFHPFFIGDGGPAVFYETNMTMTGSLYRPNRRLLEQFMNLHELTTLVAEHPITTRRLDDIEGLDDVDMLKIDVQGAELTVFQNAPRVLSQAVLIHTEVEFVQLYEGQPLFAQVDEYLRSCGFQLHTFAGFGTRNFKPLMVGDNPNRGLRQVLWADAIYIRDFLRFDELAPGKLLKLAIIAHEIYKSFDLCCRALLFFDKQQGTNLCGAYLSFLREGQQCAT